ncbi:Vacuolar protein sorting-associated protein ist1, partial [Coemansia brasiliensis]
MPSFPLNKFKTELKLASNRLQFLQAKQQSLSAKARRDIALLLENGKLASAEIRVESIIRDDLHIEAMEIVELFCELLHARAAIIDQATELDRGLCEAVHSVIYASSRIQVKELPHIRDILGLKYGKELVKNALVNADELVNGKLLKKLSLDPPAPKLVQLYLKEIAAAYSVDWAPQDGDGDGGGSPSFGFKEPVDTATPPEALSSINSDADEADARNSKDTAADQEEGSDAGIGQLSPPPTHKTQARSTSPAAAKPVPVSAKPISASTKAASSKPKADPPSKE